MLRSLDAGQANAFQNGKKAEFHDASVEIVKLCYVQFDECSTIINSMTISRFFRADIKFPSYKTSNFDGQRLMRSVLLAKSILASSGHYQSDFSRCSRHLQGKIPRRPWQGRNGRGGTRRPPRAAVTGTITSSKRNEWEERLRFFRRILPDADTT